MPIINPFDSALNPYFTFLMLGWAFYIYSSLSCGFLLCFFSTSTGGRLRGQDEDRRDLLISVCLLFLSKSSHACCFTLAAAMVSHLQYNLALCKPSPSPTPSLLHPPGLGGLLALQELSSEQMWYCINTCVISSSAMALWDSYICS